MISYSLLTNDKTLLHNAQERSREIMQERVSEADYQTVKDISETLIAAKAGQVPLEQEEIKRHPAYQIIFEEEQKEEVVIFDRRQDQSSVRGSFLEQVKTTYGKSMKDFLTELYFQQNKTQKQIAEQLGCSQGYISFLIIKYGIKSTLRKRHRRKMALKLTNQKVVEVQYGKPLKDILTFMYEIEHKSLRQIAVDLDFSHGTIHIWCKECGIQMRKGKEVKKDKENEK